MTPLVYKYVTPARIDVLQNGRIRFTQPCTLNDPFECSPGMSAYCERVKAVFKEILAAHGAPIDEDFIDELCFSRLDTLTTGFSRLVSQVCVFLSLSQVRDNLLMWSHYAQDHTGFVIGFDSSHPFFAPGTLSLSGLRQVEYSRDRIVFPNSGFEGLTPNERRELNAQLIYRKSFEWSYEQELRLIARPQDANQVIESIPQPILLFDFPRDAVREVIVGTRAVSETKSRIVDSVRSGCPNATILQAQLDLASFALEFIPYDQAANRESRKQAFDAKFPKAIGQLG